MAQEKIMVFVETWQGTPKRTSLEILSKARAMGEVSAVVLGRGAGRVADELGAYGPSKIFVAENAAYDDYLVLPAAETLAALIEREQPDLVLFASTVMGKDLAPRLASRLGAPLLADLVDLEFVEGQVRGHSAPLGGNVLVTSRTVGEGVCFATVRPKSFTASTVEGAGSAVEVWSEAPSAGALLARVLGLAGEKSQALSLEEADIIVSGGRGMRGPENFAILRELAEALGGVVGASRAAVDSGWVPGTYQVGQSGKTVKPKLYIACGISGAIQHKVGMQGSEHIVAINKD
ncbi:MAG: electron transfer flavoprotein subunit alpha/FixB family protein, partial [Chloroflexota bacterium]